MMLCRIKKLKCIETEDWRTDECRLEIFADGVFQPPPLRKNMRQSGDWPINRQYRFQHELSVKLWDEDTPDESDHLGTVDIAARAQARAMESFTEDGADYRLYFEVEPRPEAQPSGWREALEEFRSSSHSGVWSYISKQDVLRGVEDRVKNLPESAYAVAQGNAPFCGPAAIVFELVRRQPTRYVQICRALFEKGGFQGRTKRVDPSLTFRRSRVRKGLAPVDWMLMGALRDTENALFDVDNESGDFAAGMTTPWEMEGWAFELLGLDKTEYESLYFYGEFEAMKKAARVVKREGVAFLMIHSAMLGNEEPLISTPNHWVSLLGNVKIDDGVWYLRDSGYIEFNCYSWGQRKQVRLGEGPFEDYIWGIVFAEAGE